MLSNGLFWFIECLSREALVRIFFASPVYVHLILPLSDIPFLFPCVSAGIWVTLSFTQSQCKMGLGCGISFLSGNS